MNHSENMILYLTLKKEFFNQIKSGEKKAEYREYKPFWTKRLMNPDNTFKCYDFILFQNGYRKDAPQMLVEFKGIKIIKERTGWFRTDKYFEIELGQIVKFTDDTNLHLNMTKKDYDHFHNSI